MTDDGLIIFIKSDVEPVTMCKPSISKKMREYNSKRPKIYKYPLNRIQFQLILLEDTAFGV